MLAKYLKTFNSGNNDKKC